MKTSSTIIASLLFAAFGSLSSLAAQSQEPCSIGALIFAYNTPKHADCKPFDKYYFESCLESAEEILVKDKQSKIKNALTCVATSGAYENQIRTLAIGYILQSPSFFEAEVISNAYQTLWEIATDSTNDNMYDRGYALATFNDAKGEAFFASAGLPFDAALTKDIRLNFNYFGYHLEEIREPEEAL